MRSIVILGTVLASFIPSVASADAGVDASDASSDAAGAANGATCAAPTDCASGFCVDNVCCDSECSGAAECSGGEYKSAPTCTTGVCKAPMPVPCTPYACGGTTCKTACTGDADCAAGFKCTDGVCGTGSPAMSVCSADGTSVTADGKETSCYPYRCDSTSGACRVACVTDAECAADRKCFTDRGVCDDPNYTGKASPTQSDEGGCSYGAATTTPLWLALAALGLLRRRQR